jgi:phosphatidylethanolamine/phosphatidyl-N-methylethanolamine N-methyltransferase
MASCVDAGTAPVLEIGAGTGVITRALLRKGISPHRLFVIEQDASLAAFLQRQFPQVRVRCGEALDARCILAEEFMGRVKTVVSSLPLRNLPIENQIQTVQAMVSVLAQEGQLVQFTYGVGCPIPSREIGLKAERLGRVWMNFPPAAVWH